MPHQSPRAAHRVGRPAAALAAAGALVFTLAPAAPGQAGPPPGNQLTIEVLSSAPDQVTGGDALVRVTAGVKTRLAEIRVTRNGADVTGAFTPDPASRTMTGLVDGLEPGTNQLRARAGRGPAARLTVHNHPIPCSSRLCRPSRRTPPAPTRPSSIRGAPGT
jgi:hypothetical protein